MEVKSDAVRSNVALEHGMLQATVALECKMKQGKG